MENDRETMIRRAQILAGRMVTDGEVCGILTLADGDNWSVTHRNGVTLTHRHTPDAHLAHLAHDPECEVRGNRYVTRPLSHLRLGVTLAKI